MNNIEVKVPVMKYPIGFKFLLRRGKNSDTQEYTVIDQLLTFSLIEPHNLIAARYVTQHNFLGQKMVTRDVVETTIDRAVHK